MQRISVRLTPLERGRVASPSSPGFLQHTAPCSQHEICLHHLFGPRKKSNSALEWYNSLQNPKAAMFRKAAVSPGYDRDDA